LPTLRGQDGHKILILYGAVEMTIENLSKVFLKEVVNIFEKNGYGNVAYDELGYLFSDYFMDSLVEAYQNDPDGFLSLVSIRGEKVQD